MIEIGVDIGGTFTDIVAVRDGEQLSFTKVTTTPKDLLVGIGEAVRKVLALAGAPPADVARFIHGTTVATNAVLEQKGAVTAVLMTDGFEDALEIGRQKRSRMYDLNMDPETPTFLAPRRRRIGIPERVDADGNVLIALDEAAVRAAVRRLKDEQGIESVAVCYLFSFLNPAHERRTRELIREVAPDVGVSLSSEIDPTFREYERVCVTAFDAYLRPVVGRYLERLGDGLAALGVNAEPEIMRSRGGIVSARLAAEQPVHLFLSGPAGGVVGALFAAERSGVRDIISIDIGGTSCDVAMVEGGKALIRREGKIAGYPVRIPMVDVNTIGAGGGSIAWLDPAGGLRVGPQSAGADPGPACYGRGGAQATVTDASLVLGYLNPGYFAGGELRLDPAEAERAVARVAERLRMSPLEAAEGIHRVLNARMADQIRLVTIQRGYDPRDFSLVLLGGAGPVHGGALADELSIGTLVVPEAPGVLSAFGLLAAAIEHHHARTFVVPTRAPDFAALNRILRDLDAEGREKMRRERVPEAEVRVAFAADMRYVGQAYELEVPLDGEVGPGNLERIANAFHATHERVYGHQRTQDPVEFVNLRAVHTYPLPRPRLRAEAPSGGTLDAARKGTRRAYFGTARGMADTPIYERARLPVGAPIAGPAIVEQRDTTTVVYPGHRATLDASGNLIIKR
jgi:N-methylhydantoinase A